MTDLKNRVAFITGASRGIGREFALMLAKHGAKVVLASKSTEPNPKLPGTLYSVAEEVKKAGGEAHVIKLDVRFEDQIDSAIKEAAETFGGLDILINNAGAIRLLGTEETTPKHYDLMQQVNTRATFLCSRAALPFLEKSSNPHILNLCPPLNLSTRWIAPHVAYTISKYGMTLCTMGMAEELREKKIAVNSLWPKTTIATAAISWLMGDEAMQQSRVPAIMADAAEAIFKRSSEKCTGNTYLDEVVLGEEGITNFEKYAVDKTKNLMPDLFLD